MRLVAHKDFLGATLARRTDPGGAGRFEVVYDDGADLLWQLAEFLRVVGANREAYTKATEPPPE